MKRRNLLRAVGGAVTLTVLAEPGAAEFCTVHCDDATQEECENDTLRRQCEKYCGGCPS